MGKERVTITVHSNLGEEGPLTVRDAMRQILDFFDLLMSAQAQEERGEAVSWQLEKVSMNSPLEATAVAFATDTAVPVDLIANRGKERLADAINEITVHNRTPRWVDQKVRRRIKEVFDRNTNGVGRTDIKISEDAPLIILVEKSAKAGIRTLERADLDDETAREDLTRSEYGSIEGDVSQATNHRGRPALVVRERVTGQDVTCVLSDDLAARIGPEHNWGEVWETTRVLVIGEIFYKSDGAVTRVSAVDIEAIDATSLAYNDIADKSFTAELTPPDYLEKLREGEIG